GGTDAAGALAILFAAKTPGPAGNNIVFNFTRTDRQGLGPTLQVVTVGVTTNINITLDTNAAAGTGGTTAQQLLNLVNNPASATSPLVSATLLSGAATTDIANPPPDAFGNPAPTQFPLPLSGGSGNAGSIEVSYTNTRATTDQRDDMADIGF